MTAIHVVTDHEELNGSGQVSHADLDNYVNTTPWLVVSGAAGVVPTGARRLVAGPGIVVIDGGPGSDLTVSAPGAAGQAISWMEIPSGSVDGLNVDFTLAHSPVPSGALMFFVNGVLQRQGNDADYVMASGNTLRLLYGYRSGSNLAASYPY